MTNITVVLFLTVFLVGVLDSNAQLCTAMAHAGSQCIFGDTEICCVHQAMCDPISGNCVCLVGKTGPLCDQNCLLTSDGTACERFCSRHDCYGDTCDHGPGNIVCTCHPLYRGPECDQCIVGNKGEDCNIACAVSSDGMSCETDCSQNVCGIYESCIGNNNECLCREGAKGPNCEIACPVDESTHTCQILCPDNQCQSLRTCIETGTGCQCLPGHYGQFCHRTCLLIGLTGLDCTIACPLASNGQSCETDCRKNPCHDSNSCVQTADECHCMLGYSGSSCDYCQPTQASGQCREHCEYSGYACEAGSVCSITTGECLCPMGQKGQTCYVCQPDSHTNDCREYCPTGCYGANNYCNTRTSQCECSAGFIGTNCEICDPSTHHSQCKGLCGRVCPVGTLCDIPTEDCTCTNGYLGRECELCRPSLNSQRCTQHCSYACEKGDCNILTRECVCQDGFRGPDCSLCEPGETNGYCREFCDVTCRNGGLCDVFDGTCYCLNSLYSGKDCSLCNKTLEDGHCQQEWGHGCMNNGRCNTSSLACECLPGYVLGDCSWCNPRQEDDRCMQHCGVECLNAGYCDTLTNTCDCPNDYTGSDCGLCIPQLHNQKCVNYCRLECQNTATCDTQLGSCICPPGFNGSDCSDKCEECRVPICDITAEDCEGTTNHPISSMGSSNPNPEDIAQANTQSLFIGIGSSVGAILILVIIILLVILRRRSNKKKRENIGETQHYSTVEPRPYESIGVSDTGKQFYMPLVTRNAGTEQNNSSAESTRIDATGQPDNGSDLYAYADMNESLAVNVERDSSTPLKNTRKNVYPDDSPRNMTDAPRPNESAGASDEIVHTYMETRNADAMENISPYAESTINAADQPDDGSYFYAYAEFNVTSEDNGRRSATQPRETSFVDVQESDAISTIETDTSASTNIPNESAYINRRVIDQRQGAGPRGKHGKEASKPSEYIEVIP